MACLQLPISEMPAEIWEHQTEGMIDVADMAGPGSVNFSLWKLIEHAVLGRVQRGSVFAEAGDTMAKYFNSSDSVVGHDEMSEFFGYFHINII